jgi:hypothetical protein
MIDDGGSAFPIPAVPGEHNAYWGMTLRDYFAGQALAGIAARDNNCVLFQASACEAYRFADAMIKARSIDFGGQS